MIPGHGLWELVQRRAEVTPNALFAVDDDDRALSFADYRDAALRMAAGLHASGVEEETRVSWALPTRLESLVLAAALARLGAVQSPILPSYREREVDFATRQCSTRLLIVPRSFRGFDYAAMADAIAARSEGLAVAIADGELPEDDPASLPPAPVATAPSSAPVRWIFYTSGTTADPKGVCHSDGTIDAFARGMADALDLRADDRVGLVFPVTHIGGIGWLFAGLAVGCSHIVVETFDPKASIDVLARHGVTQATAGTVFHQSYLAAQRERGETAIFSHLRALPGGGAPKPPELHFDCVRELGAPIVSGYGMTECPTLAMNRLGDDDEKLAHTEGRASPSGTEILVVRADGTPASPGAEGEIRVRGPQSFCGYVDTALDRTAFDDQGFFRTGDLGHLDDDGYIVITGRTKDVIIRKGENISAKEIEDLLYPHPKIADVAVIGLPDETRGERCCAVVACNDDANPLGFEEMVAFLRAEKLMPQKIPEQLELLPVLPRNATGKVLKHELRKRYADRAWESRVGSLG